MRKLAKILTVFCVLMAIISIMAIPASAATADISPRSPGWGGSFSVLKQISSSNASTYPKHVRAIERFLGYYGYDNILSEQGMTDGDFNTALITAINSYKSTLGLSQNGKVDTDTWEGIEAELWDSTNGETGSSCLTWFQMGYNGAYIYQVVGDSSYTFKYYDGNDRYYPLSTNQFYPE